MSVLIFHSLASSYSNFQYFSFLLTSLLCSAPLSILSSRRKNRNRKKNKNKKDKSKKMKNKNRKKRNSPLSK